jgi:hypothetical protein
VFTFHLANGLCLHAQFRNHTSYSVHLIWNCCWDD